MKTFGELMKTNPFIDVAECVNRNGEEVFEPIPDDVLVVSARQIDAGFWEIVLDI